MLRSMIWKIFITCIVIFCKYQVLALDITDECNSAGLDEKCDCGKCLPGLLCNEQNICKIDVGTCESFKWTNDKWKPKCDEDGSFSAKQCKGEYLNGRCFCFNSKGSRIFGWSWWNSAENMTCACSRRKHELNQREDVSLHCAENGNYEALQCDNGLCWCVEPMTGKSTQRAYPESLMTYLPCYSTKIVGSQYLRVCDSKSIARAKILAKMKNHGHEYFYLDNVLCDDDGSYSSRQINRNIVRCTWKDGKNIENYQTTVNNLATTDCNCARDSLIYAEANLEFRLICQTNGNYEPLQNSNGYPFCVDKDGFATTELGSIGQNLNCKT